MTHTKKERWMITHKIKQALCIINSRTQVDHSKVLLTSLYEIFYHKKLKKMYKKFEKAFHKARKNIKKCLTSLDTTEIQVKARMIPRCTHLHAKDETD